MIKRTNKLANDFHRRTDWWTDRQNVIDWPADGQENGRRKTLHKRFELGPKFRRSIENGTKLSSLSSPEYIETYPVPPHLLLLFLLFLFLLLLLFLFFLHLLLLKSSWSSYRLSAFVHSVMSWFISFSHSYFLYVFRFFYFSSFSFFLHFSFFLPSYHKRRLSPCRKKS